MTTADLSLSYEAAPTFSTPLRFFLTGPLFGALAGAVLLFVPDLLGSRWTPGALALTHLIAVGFMLNIMFGALFQILPVVAGAAIPHARIVAGIVHVGLATGAASLTWGLGAGSPPFLNAAVVLLGITFGVFLVAAGYGLRRTPIAQATPRDLRFALLGFGIAATLGMALAMILSGGLSLPLVTVVKLHVGWAWLGGSGLLLAATSWIVVPMFQITPNYPARLTRYWALLTCAALVAWSAAVLAGFSLLEFILAIVLAALSGAFAITTLRLQTRSRRSVPDNTTRAFQLAMSCMIAGLLCVVAAHRFDHDVWPVLAGILILHGGFVTAIVGMLYKIVPFLAWLHLSQAGMKAPNMKKLQPDGPIRKHLIAHAVALAVLLVAALSGSTLVVRAAGVLVMLEFGLLFANLMRVLGAYRIARSA